MTLPSWVGVGEPRGRLGGLYAKKRYNLPHIGVHHTSGPVGTALAVSEGHSLFCINMAYRGTGTAGDYYDLQPLLRAPPATPARRRRARRACPTRVRGVNEALCGMPGVHVAHFGPMCLTTRGCFQ